MTLIMIDSLNTMLKLHAQYAYVPAYFCSQLTINFTITESNILRLKTNYTVSQKTHQL